MNQQARAKRSRDPTPDNTDLWIPLRIHGRASRGFLCFSESRVHRTRVKSSGGPTQQMAAQHRHTRRASKPIIGQPWASPERTRCSRPRIPTVISSEKLQNLVRDLREALRATGTMRRTSGKAPDARPARHPEVRLVPKAVPRASKEQPTRLLSRAETRFRSGLPVYRGGRI